MDEHLACGVFNEKNQWFFKLDFTNKDQVSANSHWILE